MVGGGHCDGGGCRGRLPKQEQFFDFILVNFIPKKSMAQEIPLRNADEHDALTKWRRYVRLGRGAIKKIKRGYNKRVRRVWRLKIKKFDG